MKNKFNNPFGITAQQYQEKNNSHQEHQQFQNSEIKSNQTTTNYSYNPYQQQTQDIPILQGKLLSTDLGINPQSIKNRFISILTMNNLDAQFIQTADMTGPICVVLCLGIFLMFKGKMHFGDIYGVSLCGTTCLWIMMNFLSQVIQNDKQKRISVYSTMSILGYCLVPITFLSIFNIFLPMKNLLGLVLSIAFCFWGTLSASMFMSQYLQLHQKKWLVAYPIFLFYLTFVFITIF